MGLAMSRHVKERVNAITVIARGKVFNANRLGISMGCKNNKKITLRKG